MLDRGTLVFVEVRYRKNPRFGSAVASITPRKIRRVIAAASVFIQKHPQYSLCPRRFDVVAMMNTQAREQIEWIPGAFTVDSLES